MELIFRYYFSTGFFTGLGWGLIGTISKPAIGVLDLATGTATAIKESSKSSLKALPKRMRPPRLVIGPGGSMPVYSVTQGLGQERMYKMNGRDYNEIYVGHEQLRSGDDDLQILITSERILVFSLSGGSGSSSSSGADGGGSGGGGSKQLLTVHHSELVSAKPITERDDDIGGAGYGRGGDKYYIEIWIEQMVLESDLPQTKRPQVRCDSVKIARNVSQQINYARTMYEEKTQAVHENGPEEAEE